MEQLMEAPESQSERIRDHLRAIGITPTQQRVEVANVLLAQPQHLSAEQLLRRISVRGGGVSKATVYNTLALFVRKGLVREVLVDPTRVFYDSNVGIHHHVYDVTTGKLADLEHDAVPVPEIRGLPEGAEVEGVDVIVRIRSTPD